MEQLVRDYQNKIELGKSLISALNQVKVGGIQKLINKINHEVRFLSKAQSTNTLKKEHIQSTNLSHYEALVVHLLKTNKCVSVFEGFHLETEDGETKKIIVDIVSDGKRKWTKVVARNPRALSLISRGEGEFGQKSIIDQGLEYIKCAQENLILYKPPVVEFYFACGIETELAGILQDMGIVVTGAIIADYQDVVSAPKISFNPLDLQSSVSEKETDEVSKLEDELSDRVSRLNSVISDDVTKLNLDVSTMLSYVSSMTNGTVDCEFRSKLLTQQALCEKKRPVKPILDRIFEGRKLYTCESALASFQMIVSILGGENEKRRAKELLQRVTVVPDAPCNLKVSGQIKERSLAIFGTGLQIQALTVTSNGGFVRAASKQGLYLDAFIHESRALSEKKEVR